MKVKSKEQKAESRKQKAERWSRICVKAGQDMAVNLIFHREKEERNK